MAMKKAKLSIIDDDKPSKNCEDDVVSPQTLASVDHLIMEEILPRLPVKSLIRFKSVCKKWKSTVSSLQFAKLHLNFSSSNRRHFIVFSTTDKFCGNEKCTSFCLLPYRESSNVKDLVKLSGGVKDVHWYNIVDSSNGVVCLYQRNDFECEKGCFFTLWNPATGEDQDITSPKGVHVSEAYGFSYVESIDDYIIVASFGSGTFEYNKFRGLYVYSVRAGKWKRVFGSYAYLRMNPWCWKWKTVRPKSDDECLAKRLRGEAVFVGDTMYWIRCKIIGFDVVSNELEKYPRLDCQGEYRSLKLFQVKGCLSLKGKRKNGVSDFWILKNSDDWSSWQKFFSADFTKISLITLSETGKCLVRQSDEFKLVDPCKEGLDCYQGNHDNFGRMVITRDHVESLFSPFGITETDDEEDTDEEEDTGEKEDIDEEVDTNKKEHTDEEEDNTGIFNRLTTNNMSSENKWLSFPPKVDDNSGTEKFDFEGDSDDYNDDDEDDDEAGYDYNEDLDDDSESYSEWETSDDERDYDPEYDGIYNNDDDDYVDHDDDDY